MTEKTGISERLLLIGQNVRFRGLKIGVSHTYGGGVTQTYGWGVSHTDFGVVGVGHFVRLGRGGENLNIFVFLFT